MKSRAETQDNFQKSFLLHRIGFPVAIEVCQWAPPADKVVERPTMGVDGVLNMIHRA